MDGRSIAVEAKQGMGHAVRMQRIGRKVGLFNVLTGDALRRAEERSHFFRVRKGQNVVECGARSTDVYFLTEGELRVLLFSREGKEVSMRTLHPGQLFGELAAVDGLPRSATVVAVTTSEIVSMGRSDFLEIVTTSPEAALWLAREFVTQIRTLTDRIFELATLNVRNRLHCELLRIAMFAGTSGNSAVIRPAPTHAELANRIGSHREAVTRELRDLTRRGIVEQDRRCLTIHDIAGLSMEVGRLSNHVSRVFPASQLGALLTYAHDRQASA